jgi:hypothetical protein
VAMRDLVQEYRELQEAQKLAPARVRAYAKKTVEPMQIYLGANSDMTFRPKDAEKLRQRLMRRIDKLAKDTGMSSDDVWNQIESRARKAGLIKPQIGKHF